MANSPLVGWQEAAALRSAPRRWSSALAGGAIILSWLYLNGPTFIWLGQSLPNLSMFNRLGLGVGSLLLIAYLARQRFHQRILHQRIHTASDANESTVLEFSLAPLLLVLGCAVGGVLARWLLGFEQLPAALFLLGSYGLVGLVLDPALWRKGLPAATAISTIIPFWVQFTTGLGFPARILTAHAVEAILHLLHLPALSSEDIIVLDTGITQVDLPCSGLKSLWTGTLLLLSLTWIEGRRIGGRWLLVALLNLELLIVVNIARVLTLVMLIQVARQPVLAEALHVPLGLMGFAVVSLAMWGLLRWVPKAERKERSAKPSTSRTTGRSWKVPRRSALLVSLLLSAGFLGLSFVPRPVNAAPLPALDHLTWDAPIQAESIPLTTAEQNFFLQHPGVIAEKQQFQSGSLSGSMILVASPTWQAHHSPEVCYISSGFLLNQMTQQPLIPGGLGRWLTLDGGSMNAAYWFQSPSRTTDNYLDRLWADITHQERTWTLVSILFDQPHQPQDPEIQTFLNTVYTRVAEVQP
ncbi:MAG: exosortase O [Synechococcales cyanobacterium M58_A2018_015]|nr:exosortase O [Synechococcales cyanobacterium M58_A2018_015]